jgi:hypothetical protein
VSTSEGRGALAFGRVLSLALIGAAGAAVSAGGQSATRVELRVEPVADLYFHARSLAAERDATVPAPYQAAVDALRALGEKLGPGLLAFGVADQRLVDVTTLDGLAERFEAVPPLFTRDGGRLPITEELRAVVAGLRAAEAYHRNEVWPLHWRLVEPARRRLETTLLPAQGAAFAYMLESLGMSDPAKTIPVYLAAHLPWPGGFTYGLQSGGGVCFVGVDRPEFAGHALAELVLHESTHALDVETEESVLARLRARLEAEGFTREDRALRDVPHTLMFVQAAETIRRHVAADHDHYGDGTSTYYDRVALARFERDLWIRHLDGEVGLDDTLGQIVARAVAERAR